MRQKTANVLICPRKLHDGTSEIRSLNADLMKIKRKLCKRRKRKKKNKLSKKETEKEKKKRRRRNRTGRNLKRRKETN